MFDRSGERSRWAVFGAVVAVLLGGGQLLTASAAGSANASSFVPITPCRLLDTRASDVVGPRAAPLGAVTTYTATVWGTNGNCTIPVGATGLSMNVVAINPSAASFLTVFPADQPLPLASSLNWVAGQAPTPNAVTVSASADGRISFYNLAGSVDLAVDIVGYYELSTSGPAGPPGAPGIPGTPGVKGDTGDPGPRPAKVVWVATSGGDFTTLSAALASITDNSGTKPYLIRIAPGIYTEASPVLLKDHVDIEGSGQDTTTITCACGTNGGSPLSAVLAVSGAGQHVEVRNLTVANTGGGGFYSFAVGTQSVTSQVSFDHVTAAVTGGGDNLGVYNSGSSPMMSNVTASATGGSDNYGVFNAAGSSPMMSNVTASASATGGGGTSNYGVYNAGSSPMMSNVTASATGGSANTGVYNAGSSPMMSNVTATATGGTTNYGVYNAGSPTMSNVTATATGGTSNYGVYNNSSSPTMTGGTASASGGSGQNTGITNYGGSPVFNTVTATGTGGTQARGVANQNSAVATLVNVTAVGSGGNSNQDWGIDNFQSSTITVRDSFITGSPNSILNSSGTVRVANTRLSTAATGTMTCINSFSATFVLLNASCQ